MTDRELEEAFSKFGRVGNEKLATSLLTLTHVGQTLTLYQVLRAQVMYDPHSREPRGFAFVTMADADAAEAAISGMTGVELMGRTLSVQKVSTHILVSARRPLLINVRFYRLAAAVLGRPRPVATLVHPRVGVSPSMLGLSHQDCSYAICLFFS